VDLFLRSFRVSVYPVIVDTCWDTW